MSLPQAWASLPFFETDWPAISARLDGLDWLPGHERVFAALSLTPPDQARVVILGQDPYPTPGHANGLAFSVTAETALPRSLKNIYAEMHDDIGHCPANGDLGHWARQGVLLLNTSLSVLPGQAGIHAKWGWDRLARQAVEYAQVRRPLAFVLWGAHAQKAMAGIPRAADLVIESAHPSPLSARRGFFGSRPFSRINDWLIARDETPIDWALSETPAAR
ncbi:uracil-DNA glycosylase [Paracoccus aestuariivivens]|uniref:Uracil-DNA glycosylase n=1 Tax=Paracoccus aestuariivivens TaxID=1820333 RepID=A0A6L6J359_9RHOB|nr:uracil-DNA glycosylase [Paracoccus aestuariivivens]MTH76360.1 uracil-DNA glycosylase [Paracoccus aestuariivivens]